MDSVVPVLFMLGAVLVSSIIVQIIPRMPIAFVQIILGVLLALTPAPVNITIDPNFFMILLIAPLLYWDALQTDKKALWVQRKPVIAMALGLVVLTVAVLGFFIYLLVPSIPLAAAFALAAALAPTDAVVVTTLGSRLEIPQDRKTLLQNESLLNDASGVVSFQFAVAALVAGTFSFVNVAVSFVWCFVGSIVIGVGLAAIKGVIIYVVRRTGLEDVTFHVIVQLITPFIFYFIVNEMGLSGILAVVAAGVVDSLDNRILIPSTARLNIVSSSVWQVLSFALNGLVFVILGTLLPNVMVRTWAGSIPNSVLILDVILICVVMMVVRYLWCYVMQQNERAKELRAHQGEETSGDEVLVDADPAEAASTEAELAETSSAGTAAAEAEPADIDAAVETLGAEADTSADVVPEAPDRFARLKALYFNKEFLLEKSVLHDALVMTLAGAKGAITLAICLSIPRVVGTGEVLQSRELIIFLGAATILLTLILANFVLPFFVAKKTSTRTNTEEIAQRIKILKNVVTELARDETITDKRALRRVIAAYETRINRTQALAGLEDSSERVLREHAIGWEALAANEAMRTQAALPIVGFGYLLELRAKLSHVVHRPAFMWFWRNCRGCRLALLRAGFADWGFGTAVRAKRREGREALRASCADSVLENLSQLSDTDGFSRRAIETVTQEYQRISSMSKAGSQHLKARGTISASSMDVVMRRALQIELEMIRRAYDADLISRDSFRIMRDNVSTMEFNLQD